MYLHLFLQVIEKQIKMDGEISEYGVWARGCWSREIMIGDAEM